MELDYYTIFFIFITLKKIYPLPSHSTKIITKKARFSTAFFFFTYLFFTLSNQRNTMTLQAMDVESQPDDSQQSKRFQSLQYRYLSVYLVVMGNNILFFQNILF